MFSVCDRQEVVVKYAVINCPDVIIGRTLPQHKVRYNYQGNKKYSCNTSFRRVTFRLGI